MKPIYDGPFWGCSLMCGGGRGPPLLRICHTYPKMITLGIVTPELKQIKKKNYLTHHLDSAGICTFCYNKEYRCRLHFST